MRNAELEGGDEYQARHVPGATSGVTNVQGWRRALAKGCPGQGLAHPETGSLARSGWPYESFAAATTQTAKIVF